MMMKYRLVVFDWDGTVMDSTSLIAECIQFAARDCDLSPPSTEAAKHIIGLGIRDSVRFLFPNLSDAGLDMFAERYRHHYLPRDGEVRLYEGLENVLRLLAHDERFLAVATGKPRRGLERAFDQCELRPFFHYTRCADEGWPKPHPDMLEKLISATGVNPSETLMIGDTTHDLEMAAAAGCHGLAVSYGAHPINVLRTAPHQAVVHTVEELGEWLKQNA
jgi:phosphoglycolate phosphatase